MGHAAGGYSGGTAMCQFWASSGHPEEDEQSAFELEHLGG